MDQNIDRTKEEGLCTACGICAAVCPVSCIRYERYKETYEPIIDYTKCIQCEKCLRVCPGYSYTYQDKAASAPLCYAVKSKHREILKNATSGGLITTMVWKLLQDRQYNIAFLVTEYNYDKQLMANPLGREDDLHNSQQSRYLPVSQEKAIKYILEKPMKKVIFVGTSCAVHGLCNVLKQMGRSRENILIIGLFCDQIMTYSIYEYLKRLKSWNRTVESIHFRDKRAGGWPGNVRIEFHDGTYMNISSKERMLVKDFCKQKRCLYCMDKLNAEADLSAGDNYTKENDSKEGSSTLIIRTSLGKQVWQYCEQEFFIYSANYNNIKKSQYIEKKIENQLKNNWIYAKEHNGRMIESGLPIDVTTLELKEKITQKDKKRLEKQLKELTLGEKGKYDIIRKKRIKKLIKMYWNGALERLHLKM